MVDTVETQDLSCRPRVVGATIVASDGSERAEMPVRTTRWAHPPVSVSFSTGWTPSISFKRIPTQSRATKSKPRRVCWTNCIKLPLSQRWGSSTTLQTRRNGTPRSEHGVRNAHSTLRQQLGASKRRSVGTPFSSFWRSAFAHLRERSFETPADLADHPWSRAWFRPIIRTTQCHVRVQPSPQKAYDRKQLHVPSKKRRSGPRHAFLVYCSMSPLWQILGCETPATEHRTGARRRRGLDMRGMKASQKPGKRLVELLVLSVGILQLANHTTS